MSSLFINDLDAGAGRMGDSTQYTVNNQMVNATLMNLADNPTNVQLPGVYKNEEIPRVPVVCTGNDFSTLYAPLIRDGRMEKYYWNPTREDRIGVCMGIFQVSALRTVLGGVRECRCVDRWCACCVVIMVAAVSEAVSDGTWLIFGAWQRVLVGAASTARYTCCHVMILMSYRMAAGEALGVLCCTTTRSLTSCHHMC